VARIIDLALGQPQFSECTSEVRIQQRIYCSLEKVSFRSIKLSGADKVKSVFDGYEVFCVRPTAAIDISQ